MLHEQLLFIVLFFPVGSRNLSLDCPIFNLCQHHEVFTSWTIRHKWQLGLHGSKWAQWWENWITASQISTMCCEQMRRSIPQGQGGHLAVCGWTNTRVVFAGMITTANDKGIYADRDECVRSRHGCAQHFGQNPGFCEHMSLGRGKRSGVDENEQEMRLTPQIWQWCTGCRIQGVGSVIGDQRMYCPNHAHWRDNGQGSCA